MAALTISEVENHKTYGDAVIARLAGAPARVKTALRAFAAVHAQYCTADRAVAKAKDARDAALGAIARADNAQDGSIDVLANAIVGAGLGSRAKPFASFTKLSPSELKVLAYATEAKTIGALVASIRKVKPEAAVRAAAENAGKQAGKTAAAIAASTKPNGAYRDAIAARDAFLPSWTLALNRLKKEAAAAWVEDPKRYQNAFAPADRVSAPKKKHAKKEAAAPAAPSAPSA